MPRPVLAILMSFILLAGCKENEPPQPAATGVATEAASSVNDFALDLYRKLAADEGNLFFSPTSISTALTMTWAGAKGETARETANVLHLGSDPGKVPADFSQLLASLNKDDSAFTLNIVNRLWGQESFPFETSYTTLIKEFFQGDLERMDFRGNSEVQRQKINQWVADQTENKIQNLMPNGSVDQNTSLVLTNAIYFLGDWVYPFDGYNTRERAFYTPNGSLVKIPAMTLNEDLRYYSDDQLAAVALPYEGHALNFIVLLPTDKKGLPSLEASLTSESLKKYSEAMSSTDVIVQLPKLDLARSIKLNDVLIQMGMEDAFSPQAADFSGMCDHCGLFISTVVHKSFLKVDEMGTEAAAATGLGVMATSMPDLDIYPQLFIADHPFLFLIQHEETGAILFMGRFENPDL